MPQLQEQQQQQQDRRLQVRFPPPLASINTPVHNHLHKPSWLHNPFQHDMEPPKLAANFSGTWLKDREASDSMADAITLMGLSGLMRQAIKLIKGITVTQDDASFSMAVFSVLSWFKVSETYSLDGTSSSCRRRDFRRGGHKGRVAVPSPDKLQLHLQWDDPYGGTGLDEFTMPSADVLHVQSTVSVNGKTCSYRQVYNRKP
ncbi:hypothetical protein COO60DRAFT_644181 [Scenedesmus sp. NREL 46B-D3]|nr:hypothetical protein COO60DRAFT_644181 [Scenedesmus sp. NREL 46B-D3]